MQWVTTGKLTISSLAAVLGIAVLATAANAQQQLRPSGGARSALVIQPQGATRAQRQARTARAQVNRSASARIRTRAVPARTAMRMLYDYAAANQGYPMMVMIAPAPRNARGSASRSTNPAMQMMYDYAAAFQGYPMPMMVMIAPRR
jgi:hypothetical protein